MILTAQYVIDAQRGFDTLAADLSDNAKDAPIGLQDRVGRALAKLSPLAKIIGKRSEKLGRDYAARDDDGKIIMNDVGNMKIDKARLEEFQERRDALLDESVELDERIKPFSLKELQKDGCKKVAIWSALLAGPLILDDIEG